MPHRKPYRWTIDIPESIAALVLATAKKEGLSVSRWFRRLAEREVTGERGTCPTCEKFLSIFAGVRHNLPADNPLSAEFAARPSLGSKGESEAGGHHGGTES